MRKLLLLDIVHENFPQMLNTIGFSTDIIQTFDEAKIISMLQKVDYDGIIVRNTKITKSIIDSASNLRFIARAGSGIENIDYDYAHKKNIAIIHSPEGNSDAVGEHALALTICLLKNIGKSWLECKNGKWDRESNRGYELGEKTIGIIGYGNTGSAFAKKLSGIDVQILAHDKYKSNFTNKIVKESSLEDIYKYADIVSFHLPLTQETINYGNSTFFKQFHKNIVLINTSRGKIVNTAHLVEAMKCGKITAAGLDVVEYEDYNFNMLKKENNEVMNYLLSSNKVIITPHIAGITQESRYKHAQILSRKIQDLYN